MITVEAIDSSSDDELFSLLGRELEQRISTKRGSPEFVAHNPFDYLMALQQHAAAVPKAPESWLPWNYEKAIAAAGSG